MVMNYGPAEARWCVLKTGAGRTDGPGGASCDMGASALQAACNVAANLFTPADAQTLLSGARALGLAGVHWWSLLNADVAARLWLGNAISTPTHFDESSNIACVAAGERRFTLFSPEQVHNLYVGPIGHAPTGTPISLVDVDAPELARFPKFEHALAAAQSAHLGPGDAIYIPPLWWHHVASRRPVNLLVNHTGGGHPVCPRVWTRCCRRSWPLGLCHPRSAKPGRPCLRIGSSRPMRPPSPTSRRPGRACSGP